MKKQLLLILAITFLSNFENALQAQNSTSIADSIYSNTLNEQRKFWVQLPENYNSKSDINTLLYMF